MVWDTTTPAGSEAASNGDNRLRELKEDLQTALRADDVSGVESVFPGSDPSAPAYRYRGIKAATAGRPASGDYGLFIDMTRNAVQRDNGSTWDDIATLIPTGTVMIFYQAAAPVGWTKQATQDDKALRVVSGGSGGSAGGTNALSTLAHTHSIASGGSHTHTLASNGTKASVNDINGSYDVGTAPGAAGLFAPVAGGGSTLTIRTANTDSQGTHDHGGTTGSAALAVAYIDVILCSKD